LYSEDAIHGKEMQGMKERYGPVEPRLYNPASFDPITLLNAAMISLAIPFQILERFSV